jgi:hypothetical protein
MVERMAVHLAVPKAAQTVALKVYPTVASMVSSKVAMTEDMMADLWVATKVAQMESNSAATLAVWKAERKDYLWVRRLADPTAARTAAK